MARRDYSKDNREMLQCVRCRFYWTKSKIQVCSRCQRKELQKYREQAIAATPQGFLKHANADTASIRGILKSLVHECIVNHFSIREVVCLLIAEAGKAYYAKYGTYCRASVAMGYCASYLRSVEGKLGNGLDLSYNKAMNALDGKGKIE